MPRKFGLRKYVYDPQTVGFIGRPTPEWKKKPKESSEKYYKRSLAKDKKKGETGAPPSET